MIWCFIGGFLLGFVIALLIDFDWSAYFKYKKDYTELVMKYKKEMEWNMK